MKKKEFIRLFLRLLVDIMGFVPVESISKGVVIYENSELNMRLPVFWGKKGIKKFANYKNKSDQDMFWEFMKNRLCMIGKRSMHNPRTKEVFPEQIVICAKSIKLNCIGAKKTQEHFGISLSPNRYIEADMVDYICHELRHIMQLKSIYPKERFSNFKKIPKLINGFRKNKLLIKVNRRFIKHQLIRYKKDNEKYDVIMRNLLADEKDAMIVGFLAFDCWLNQQMTYEEKVRKLQEILKSKQV